MSFVIAQTNANSWLSGWAIKHIAFGSMTPRVAKITMPSGLFLILVPTFSLSVTISLRPLHSGMFPPSGFPRSVVTAPPLLFFSSPPRSTCAVTSPWKRNLVRRGLGLFLHPRARPWPSILALPSTLNVVPRLSISSSISSRK